MRLNRRTLFLSLALLLTFLSVPFKLRALDNGLARTPPMGWNTWNKFGCNVSDTLVRGAADAIVSSGMKDAGYRYVVIDDCWQVSRDAQGNIVPDAKRFPNGIKPVADYVHSKGLLFGIYSDAGTGTCENRPGGRGYEFQDARQYAAWGVDYLKYDWCNHSTQNSEASYSIMRDALAKSGRPIVFSLCEWGSTKPWLWAKNVGNLWRTTGDITDRWSVPDKNDLIGVLQILDQENGLESYAGPGHWNDPDMLEVGNGGMKDNEYRMHMSLWCLLAAPLMAGNDLTTMTPQTLAILTNPEVLAVDQDPAGIQGRIIMEQGPIVVMMKPMVDGSKAVGFFNREQGVVTIPVKFSDLGLGEAASVRDLWEKKDLGTFHGSFTTDVPEHGVVFVRIKSK